MWGAPALVICACPGISMGLHLLESASDSSRPRTSPSSDFRRPPRLLLPPAQDGSSVAGQAWLSLPPLRLVGPVPRFLFAASPWFLQLVCLRRPLRRLVAGFCSGCRRQETNDPVLPVPQLAPLRGAGSGEAKEPAPTPGAWTGCPTSRRTVGSGHRPCAVSPLCSLLSTENGADPFLRIHPVRMDLGTPWQPGGSCSKVALPDFKEKCVPP